MNFKRMNLSKGMSGRVERKMEKTSNPIEIRKIKAVSSKLNEVDFTPSISKIRNIPRVNKVSGRRCR